jgi:hypothetical protein
VRLIAVVLATLTLGLASQFAKDPQTKQVAKIGVLKLVVIDEETGQPTPARVEILDAQNKAYLAEDALLIGGDGPVDREVPWKGTLEEHLASLTRKITNRYTGTDQFYAGGSCRVSIPAGTYRVRVFKGLEYHVPTERVHVKAGETARMVVKLKRWINLPRQGWYSGESHLHIPRPFKEVNPYVTKWMQAEDIHVANLLQWGNSKHFYNTVQYAHGPEGLYHEGDYWLASGQENPRTHFLGHTVTYGARAEINFPDTYVIYQRFWEESRRQKALSGWVHFAMVSGGQNGIAIDLLDGLVSFIEVLSFDSSYYEVWYDALNLGQRVTPIAGTDFACGPYVPGRERFYTRVEGKLNYDAWLEGVRRGRTFVTNGPILEVSVNGKGLGEEVILKKRGPVRIDARVRWDPVRDEVERLELVANGEVVRSLPRQERAGQITAQFDYEVPETSWLAVRVSGKKLLEGKSPYTPKQQFYHHVSPLAAHSAAIYVTVENTPGLSAQSRAKLVATAWLNRLDELEKRLAEEKIARWPTGNLDGVDADYLSKNRSALLERIASAKKRFRELAR